MAFGRVPCGFFQGPWTSIAVRLGRLCNRERLRATDTLRGTSQEIIDLDQRTPWGGGKKRGVENLTNDTPPKKGVLDPPSYGTFSTPLGCQCSVFPVQKSTTEATRSSFGGPNKFSGERVLRYVFLPPYVLHPPISRPNWKCFGGLIFWHAYCDLVTRKHW